MKTRLPLILGLAAILVAGVAVGRGLPIGAWLTGLVDYVRGAGALGVAVFAVAYVAATVSMVSGAVLTLGAGFVYGPVLGTLIVSPVSVIAATVAFALGRSVARGWISRRMAGSVRFSAIDEAVGREGLKIVLLLRLSPLFPFTVLNYALGLTRVRLRDYVLGSWIGMLPGTVLYVYLGSLVTSASGLLSGQGGASGGATRIFYVVGLVATVAVAVVVGRTARRALDRSLERPVAEATS
ncbi:MAG: TVP38/TMEM64 family protein [Vicinamibacterales bacterium]